MDSEQTPPGRPALLVLADSLDRFSNRTGRIIAWLSLLMVVVTFFVVVLRYVFDLGWIAMQESVTYMHATLFMLGAAYTLERNGHVRVDILYQGMSRRGKAWVDLLGTLLLLMPVCGFIAWIAWEYVQNSWQVTEGSREAGGIPGVFLLKSLLLIMPLLVMLQGLAMMIRNGLFLAGFETALPPVEGVGGEDPGNASD